MTIWKEGAPRENSYEAQLSTFETFSKWTKDGSLIRIMMPSQLGLKNVLKVD